MVLNQIFCGILLKDIFLFFKENLISIFAGKDYVKSQYLLVRKQSNPNFSLY